MVALTCTSHVIGKRYIVQVPDVDTARLVTVVNICAKTSFPVFFCFCQLCWAYLGSTHDTQNKSLKLKEIVHSGKDDDLSTSLSIYGYNKPYRA